MALSVVAEWDDYLDGLASSGSASPAAVAVARRVSAPIIAISQSQPGAGPTPGGGFQAVWRAGDHHYQIDIEPDGSASWFYANVVTKASDGGSVGVEWRGAVDIARLDEEPGMVLAP